MHPDVATFAKRYTLATLADQSDVPTDYADPFKTIGELRSYYAEMAKAVETLAKALARAASTICIGQSTYVVSQDKEDSTRTRVVKYGSWNRAEHEGGDYTVDGKHGADSLQWGPNAGYSCDCPDFANRHRGTGSQGCKHVIGLATFGMLPDLAELPELTSEDYAEARGERQFEESRS